MDEEGRERVMRDYYERRAPLLDRVYREAGGPSGWTLVMVADLQAAFRAGLGAIHSSSGFATSSSPSDSQRGVVKRPVRSRRISPLRSRPEEPWREFVQLHSLPTRGAHGRGGASVWRSDASDILRSALYKFSFVFGSDLARA